MICSTNHSPAFITPASLHSTTAFTNGVDVSLGTFEPVPLRQTHGFHDLFFLLLCQRIKSRVRSPVKKYGFLMTINNWRLWEDRRKSNPIKSESKISRECSHQLFCVFADFMYFGFQLEIIGSLDLLSESILYVVWLSFHCWCHAPVVIILPRFIVGY